MNAFVLFSKHGYHILEFNQYNVESICNEMYRQVHFFPILIING